MPAFTITQHLVPTHAFEGAPKLDILIITSGMGGFQTLDQPRIGQLNPVTVDPIVNLIKQRYPKLQRPDHSVHGRGHCGTHGPA
jgi:hypothetical protein